MTAADAFTSAYDSKAPQETTKKAQVNAIYQLASPHPSRQAQKGAAKHKKKRHRTAHQPEGSHTERCRPSPEKRSGIFLKTKV
jgi:hypothetical protein